MSLYSVRPLYSASVTATNGSDTITVTGNVNCSFLMAGAIVFITGSNRAVEAVSGTGALGGNSTIKLRRPWDGATITGSMLVFMSYEGLADAVFQLKTIIDKAASTEDIGIGFMGNYDLATNNVLPPAPTDGTGSRMYRVGSEATISGVIYRVGDLIYYDHYMNVWRKCNEVMNAAGIGSFVDLTSNYSTQWSTPQQCYKKGFSQGLIDGNTLGIEGLAVGTYGTLTINAQSADANSIYALSQEFAYGGAKWTRCAATATTWQPWKKVLVAGDFGIGAVVPDTHTVPLNDLIVRGTYNVSGGTADWPFGGSGGTITVDSHGNNSFVTQTAHSAATNLKSVRFKSASTWSRWFTEYSQANILGTVSQTAGVPTGAIIQRGGNANGQFTRLADGTQDCWTVVASTTTPTAPYGSIFRTNALLWAYPIAFADGNVSFHANEHGGIGFCWAGLGENGVTATTAGYCGFRAAAVSLSMTFSLSAKGRWY